MYAARKKSPTLPKNINEAFNQIRELQKSCYLEMNSLFNQVMTKV